jgi:hypothetical protein
MKRFNASSIAGKAVLSTLLTSALLLIFSAFTLTTAVSAAELVVNGGFENPVVPTNVRDRGWATYYGVNQPLGTDDDCPVNIANLPSDDNCNDDLRVPGWSVFWTDDITEGQQFTPGRLEIQTGDIIGVPAYEGLQKAELDSHHRVDNNNTNVTIAQFIPTCPYEDYTLSYAWKSRTEDEGDNTVHVYIDENERVTHTQNSEWQLETLGFTSNDSGQTLILFGSIGTESTTGMFLDDVNVTGPDCSLVCDEKPYDMTFRYDGDDDSHHSQSGNEVVIYPEVVYPFPDSATIEVYGHKKKDPKLLDTFYDVSIGQLFTVSQIWRNKSRRIPPRLTFKIYEPGVDDADDVLVQTVTFHTSCSQPLNGHDEFGAITVWNALPAPD